MSERTELLQEYSQALTEFDRAKSHLDALKSQIKDLGTFREDNWNVDVSIITRRSVSLGAIEKKRPDLIKIFEDEGLITVSESERLTIKLLPEGEQ